MENLGKTAGFVALLLAAWVGLIVYSNQAVDPGSYEILGGQAIFTFVEVDPQTGVSDSELARLSNQICDGEPVCGVMYWTDRSEAATELPMTEAQLESMLAQFNINRNTGLEELVRF